MSKGPVLILGARSDIGRAAARHFAAAGHPVQLALRNCGNAEAELTDMKLRYDVPISVHEFDALAAETHAEFVSSLPELPAVAVCAVGYMGDQAESEKDAAAAARVMRSNYEGPAGILAELANRFAARGSGTLVGISSVAGERGRAANYVYGSAKAGFTAFLSGLRNRLAGQGVHVVTVLPGFVYTRMTEHMELPETLTARPEEVARAIGRAVDKGRNVIFVRPVWKLIMLAIRSIPEAIFKKTRI